MINLNFPQPVHDISNFFNHGQELKQAQDALRLGSKRLVIVVGEREIGKTSFQNVTMEWLRELNQPPYLVDIPMIGNIQTVDELALEILGIIPGNWSDICRYGICPTRTASNTD